MAVRVKIVEESQDTVNLKSVDESASVNIKSVYESVSAYNRFLQSLGIVDEIKIATLNTSGEVIGEPIIVPYAIKASQDDLGNPITTYYISKDNAIETFLSKEDFDKAIANYATTQDLLQVKEDLSNVMKEVFENSDYNALKNIPYIFVDKVADLAKKSVSEGVIAYIAETQERYEYKNGEWIEFVAGTKDAIKDITINEVKGIVEENAVDFNISVDGGAIGRGAPLPGGSTSDPEHGNLLGTFDHEQLINRDSDNQHPINAVTGLENRLQLIERAINDSSVNQKIIDEISNQLNNGLKTKAKGLYYGIARDEVKPYWWLCSEIDPVSGQGTPSSIIAGPYDLGQGGGGSGGGSISMTTVDLTNYDEDGNYLWPNNVVVGAPCELPVIWSSTRNGRPTGKGKLALYIDGELVETINTDKSPAVFNLTGKIKSSANTIEIKLTDVYSNTTNLFGSITGVDVRLTSNFNAAKAYETVIFTYTPIGRIDKTMHIILDDNTENRRDITREIATSGEQQVELISGLSHGEHSLTAYFECSVDGETVKSNELKYALVIARKNETTPIIASSFAELEQEQYISFNIPYIVYTPNRNTSVVTLSVNGEVVNTLASVEPSLRYWEFKSDTTGDYLLTISTGENVSKSFNIHIYPSTVQITPIAQNLQLALSSYGRTNEETLTPEELQAGKTEHPREVWEDKEHNIKCQLSNFSYTGKADGWQLDAEGNTVLRVAGDARVTIPFQPFATDAKALGKTIELEFATSSVRNYESIIIQCLDRADAVKASVWNAGGEERQNKIDATASMAAFVAAVGTPGTYEFIYTENGWTKNNIEVDLEDFGITVSNASGGSEVIPVINDKITVIYGALDRGFYVTPQLARIDSQQMSISTQYKEEDHVRLAFVIDSSAADKLISMYINGILSSVVRYPADDSFKQSVPQNILIGSNDATVDIYNIRVYNIALNSRQIVNNWIADTQSGALKAERARRNDNFNGAGEIAISELPNDLPYLILKGPALPTSKAAKETLDVTYVDPTNRLNNFTSTAAQVGVQGTSSQYYYRKNFKIKYNNGFDNEFWEDDAEAGISDYHRKKYPLTEGATPEKTFTYKADVASSEGANNVVLVKFFEDTKNFLTPPEKDKGEHKIRMGIDGYPIIAFYDDLSGQGPKFYGKMNFNNDKGTDSTFGFKEGDESWEILANTNNIANFIKNPRTWESDWRDWSNAFESRYPEKVLIEGTNNERMYGTEEGELDRLKTLVEWVASTRQEDATNEDLPAPYEGEELVERSVTETIEVKNPDGSVEEREVTNTKKVWEKQTFTKDTRAYRIAKFRKELETIGKVDKRCSLFYYLFTELFLLVDNWTKNAFPTWYRTRHDDITGLEIPGDKWYWLPYDMDTAIGTNNEGLLVFSPYLEDTDRVNGAYVYNGQDSVFWTNIRDAFSDELASMYKELRTSGWSFDAIDKRFAEHQKKWSESIFNEDAYTKYLVPLKTMGNASYLGMAQGSKEQQRRWWLYNRFKYLDSKYSAGDATAKTIMMRAYQRSDFHMIPYSDVYIGARFDNAIVTKRAQRDTRYELSAPASWNPQDKDSVVAVYSADQLRDLGDLSGFKIGGFADFTYAARLQRLIVGSDAVGYSNAKLETLSVGGNTMLTEINVNNCVELKGSLNLEDCINIEKVYAINTKISSVNLPVGGSLKELKLPDTITNLTIRGHSGLTKLEIAGTKNIERLWLENIPSDVIDAQAIISQMRPNSVVRLIGINNRFETVEDIEDFYDSLDTMSGLDLNGDDLDKAQVTGQIYIKDIDWAALQALTERRPEVTIVAENVWCTVNFISAGNLHSTSVLKKGTKVSRPANPTKTPTPEADGTIKYYYTFNSWDRDLSEAIQSDVDINAIYDEHIQTYKVYFNTRSEKIHLEPSFIEVPYDTVINAPAIQNTIKVDAEGNQLPTIIENTIPTGVSLDTWETLDGLDFDFTKGIRKQHTLFAKWQDDAAPTLDISASDYKTIHMDASDNVGIVAYILKQSTVDPVVEDPGWVSIDGKTRLVQDLIINHDGYWKVAVKDSDNNIKTKTIVARKINVTSGVGVFSVTVADAGEVVDTFALDGSQLTFSYVLNHHYELGVLKVNGVEKEMNSTMTVASDLNVDVTCSPENYTVTFDLFDRITQRERGTEIPVQTIEYLYHAVEPEPQTDSGYVIENWYADPEYRTVYNFTTTPLEENITLYAKWIESHDPSLIEIKVEDPSVEVELCFYQSEGFGTLVDWGDGETKKEDMAGSITLTHKYSEAKTYTIGVTRQSGVVLLGFNSSKAVVNPASLIRSVTFAPDVPYTNEYAFKDAVNLQSAGLTRYMTKISAGCFDGCTGLKALSMQPNLTTIERRAFAGCTGIEGTITMPTKLKVIAEQAFEGCSKLETVVLDEALETLGSGAFQNCAKLTNINITSGIKVIDSFTFAGCTSLTSLNIPMTVESLGTAAFRGCSGLTSMKLINKDLKIDRGGQIFDGCTQLATVGPLNGNYDLEYAWVDEIPASAFAVSGNYNSFTSVYLVTGLKKIGNSAFQNCRDLQAINFPATLEFIDESAFQNCSSLTSISIPGSVTTIGYKAFINCQGLLTAYLHNTSSTVKITIPSFAWFYSCSNQLRIHVLSSLTQNGNTLEAQFGNYWNCNAESGTSLFWHQYSADLTE